MDKIFSFCNQKGGVGKTTTVTNLAALLALADQRVLLIDMDSQGNATSGLGVEKTNLEFTTYQLLVDNIEIEQAIKETSIKNLHIIPSNSDLAGAEIDLVNKMKREYMLQSKLEKVSDKYDFILIDCPPSLGLLSINALTASSYVIIPMQCEYYAMEGLSQLLNTYELVKKYLNSDLSIGGIVLTMVDFRTNQAQQVIEEVRNYFKDKVFESVIPRSVKLSEAPSFGKPAVLYDPNCRGSQSYVNFSEEFKKRFFDEKVEEVSSEEKNEETEGDENCSAVEGEELREESSEQKIILNRNPEEKKEEQSPEVSQAEV